MTEATNPSEVARETLRRLAMRRVAPTPENYRSLYHEIAGTQAAEEFPERSLKTLVSALPRKTPEQTKFARQLDAAVNLGKWESVRGAVSDFATKVGAESPNWSALIRELLTQLEKNHAGLTATKKRESLDHVLGSSTASELLFSRLSSILRSWSDTSVAGEPGAVEAAVVADTATSLPTSAGKATLSATDVTPLRDLIVQLLEGPIAVMVDDHPELTQEARDIAAAVRGALGAAQLVPLGERLKKFSYKLNFLAEDQLELKSALLRLIQLIVDNISELVVDDQWLIGQMTVVRSLVSEPLSLRRLDDVERRMKDVILKQSTLKGSLNEAKDRLKQMLATFVDRLADFSEKTSGYHDKIELCADRISKANDISELSDVLDEVMRETRVIQLNAQRSRDELRDMRTRVDDAEKEVARLQDELAQASDMVRLDALTGALNRKGMDEALDREVARTRRHEGSLCVALLDIDNFKKLNDGLGHAAGDQALIHLVKVTQESLRPQDTLARYGGEEFVVLLPDTSVDDAVLTMVRVQRELTRKFFLHKNDKVLITFSCGVAELGPAEDPHEAIKRADAGMYLAKRGGKNRVVPT